MEAIKEKIQLRKEFRTIRNKLPRTRRKNAESKALDVVIRLCFAHSYALSYTSFLSEYNTLSLNRFLAYTGKLLLPKVNDQELHIFHVENPDTQLEQNKWGIFEPIPEKCRRANLSDVTLALIPGLGFDVYNNRLGYGKGYYDRFLHSLPKPIQSYGLGFKEQFSKKPLPRHSTDVLLSELLLF